jgi:nitrous oxide reductase accessory protein NosL
MKSFRHGIAIMICTMLAVTAADSASSASSAPGAAPQPGGRDKCPVCGMFVAKYPEWTASLTFKDGRSEFFDGAKDLLRYYHGLIRYAPGRQQADIREMRVKDYYSQVSIDARSAWYVVGGDVLGPMGREAVPFGKQADARTFLADHHGRKVLRFADMTPEILKGLE